MSKTATPPAPPQRPLAKSFEPQQFESELYHFWDENRCFEAADTNAAGQEAYCIVIPPPNVTGVLHMGHALTNAIQDALVRWRRMRGENVLWLPGTDHAGIATQMQVEKQIAKEGKGPTGRPLSRHDLGREKFLERTWAWKEQHADQIKNQLKRLGSSLDWKRERFTMDEGLSKAVREVFVRLFEEGLIYRGERIINWCPRCQTALSDLEVIPTERKGSLWHIRYKIAGTSESVVIATTRPETLLGDSALAVHPDDPRYAAIHGKKALLPLLGREIPIITDAYVDQTFGSGALKVTPAHDFNDADLGARHSLAVISVMGKDGKITSEGGPYAGLSYTGSNTARERVVADLDAAGVLVKIEPHANKIGLCQRCDQVAEPMMSKQWFVSIDRLAKPAIAAVEKGDITFTPKTWEKTYFEWMHNIRDWCISRQLWWGHQIPAWHCGKCEGITVARTAPATCSKCGAPSSALTQDPDVLDTWFSSALWPFSTLGWPEQTPTLKTFYPTSVLETGFDIIFFWVSRMIMMGLHFMDDVPFRKVYLHAMVRDEKGEKMSKSKGNVIDPLTLIDQHGADPLRFTLLAMAGQGRDIKLSVDRVEGYRAFCNKFWNATKFLHLQLEQEGAEPIAAPSGGVERWIQKHRAELLPQHRWILSRLENVTCVVTQGFENFELNTAAQALYEFVWKEFCDWWIEFAKLPLREGGALRQQTLYVLHAVLERSCRLMHPLMPFVTEELWQSLPWLDDAGQAQTPTRVTLGLSPLRSIMLRPFPQSIAAWRDPDAEHTITALQAVIEAVRNFRGENNLSPKIELDVQYSARSAAALSFLKLFEPEIMGLVRLKSFDHVPSTSDTPVQKSDWAVIPIAQPPIELRISVKGLIDPQAELARLDKEIEKTREEIARLDRKLTQESFLAKAPPELVAAERSKRAEFEAKLTQLQAQRHPAGTP